MSRSNQYIYAYQAALNPSYFKRKHFKNLLPVSKTRRVVLLTNEDITNLKLLSKIFNSKYQGTLTNSRVIRLLLKKVMDDLGLPNNADLHRKKSKTLKTILDKIEYLQQGE